MTDITFTKTLAMIQQYIYKPKMEDNWVENASGERQTIDVYLCQKYKDDGTEVGGVMLKIIFNYGNTASSESWVNPAHTEENDVFEDNGEGYKRYYTYGIIPSLDYVYISKVYDMALTEGFKMFCASKEEVYEKEMEKYSQRPPRRPR